MALGRKQKRTERSKLDATPPWDERVRAEAAATTGPYDERDAPDDGIERVDLGALRVPVTGGLRLSLEVNDAQQVLAVTLGMPSGGVQLSVYAAPRNEGIWDDIRGQIAESMRAQKGITAERADGTWGVEVTGTMPGERGRTPVRIAGIDGPRWLLRATFLGAAADPAKAEPLEQALRQVVVVRGTDPLPVGEPVPLRLPKDVELPDAGAGEADDAAPGGDGVAT